MTNQFEYTPWLPPAEPHRSRPTAECHEIVQLDPVEPSRDVIAMRRVLTMDIIEERACVRHGNRPSLHPFGPADDLAGMALRLGVRLGKPGVYTLHADGRQVAPDDLHAARAVAWHAVVAGTALIATLAWTLRS